MDASEPWASPDPGLPRRPDVPPGPPSQPYDPPPHPNGPDPAWPSVQPSGSYGSQGYGSDASVPRADGSYGAQPYGSDPAWPGSQHYDPYGQQRYAPEPRWPEPYGGQPSYGYAPQPYAGYPPYGPQRPYGPPEQWQPPRRQPWVVPAPPGTPYHRLARTALHRWWRPLVGTLFLLVVGFLAVMAVTIFVMIVYAVSTGHGPQGSGQSFFQNPTAELAFELLTLGILTPAVLLTVWVVQRRPVGSVVSVTGRLRWKWLLVCAGLAVGFCATEFAMSYLVTAVFTNEPLTAPQWAGWHTFLLPALVIVLLVPFQSTAEEFVFRGWFVQAIAACTLETRNGPVGRAFSLVFRTPWPALIISAAIFTSGHGYTGWAMLSTFLFGLLAGWLAVRTGGLEAGIALHVCNNLMAFLLPAAAGQLADSLKQGGAPWYAMLSEVIPLALYGLAVLLMARRFKVQTVSA